THDSTCQILHLAIHRPFAQWSVVGVINLEDEAISRVIQLGGDLQLPTGEDCFYAVFDYWNLSYLGICSEKLVLDLAPCDTRVLRLTALPKRQRGEAEGALWLSSSRHITQGAVEMQELDEDVAVKTLSGRTVCVAGEELKLYFLLPEGTQLQDCTHPWEQADRLLTLRLKGDGEEAWRFGWRNKN
ncbi:MAG: hypothetical protein PHS41_07270, partial [Victivallaceae bacterium]|nr:hypothetical protein [Victivallaceae bacterium]